MARKVGPRILCVDDEPRVLDGLALHLRKFDAMMATSGEAGLKILESAPCAVVVSDMRMPQMNGAAFLKQVKQRWPDTVRILLTGYTDIESAIAAVNDGEIFRFLTKPCPPDRLVATIDAAVEQNRLLTAEKELLEKTLRGSIHMLCDIISLTNPVAFGRANRIKKLVVSILDALGEMNRWHIEVAALLVEIGAITLPQETLEKVHRGERLTLHEQVVVDNLPAVARKILGSIPRLEPVLDVLGELSMTSPVSVGARTLRVAMDFDNHETRGLSRAKALDSMRGQHDRYDAAVLDKLGEVIGVGPAEPIRQVALREVEVGMTFAEDVLSPSGMLMVARGYQATESFVARVRNFSEEQLAALVRIESKS